MKKSILRNSRTVRRLCLYFPKLIESDDLSRIHGKRLASITLASCNLMKIPVHALRSQRYLNTLVIDNNIKLTSISDFCFKNMMFSDTLGHLYLGNNNISYIGRGAFIELVNLTLLWLTGNNLQEINPEIISASNNLWMLNLKFNRLTELPVGLLLKLRQTLVFMSNEISRISETAAQIIQANQLRVTLNRNLINCDCRLIQLLMVFKNITYDQHVRRKVVCASPMLLSGKPLQSLNMSDCIASNVSNVIITSSFTATSNEVVMKSSNVVIGFTLLLTLKISVFNRCM
ncbi:Uncharacterised protein at_DN1020 [Pycnogonum litorale]